MTTLEILNLFECRDVPACLTRCSGKLKLVRILIDSKAWACSLKAPCLGKPYPDSLPNWEHPSFALDSSFGPD